MNKVNSFLTGLRAILTKVFETAPVYPDTVPMRPDLAKMNGTHDGSVMYAIDLGDAVSTARFETMSHAVRYANRHFPDADFHIVQVNAPIAPPVNPRVPYGSRRWSGAERVPFPTMRPANGELHPYGAQSAQRPPGAIDIHPDGDFLM